MSVVNYLLTDGQEHLTFFIVIACIILVYRAYRKEKTNPILVYLIVICNGLILVSLYVFSDYIPKIIRYTIQDGQAIVQSIFFLIYIDYTAFDKIRGRTIILSSLLSGVYLLFLLLFSLGLPEEFYWEVLDGIIFPLFMISSIYLVIIFLSLGIMIVKKTPRPLKKMAMILLVAMVLYLISSLVFSQISIPISTPEGIVDGMFSFYGNASSIVLVTYVISKAPAIFLVLPFKTVRLSVISTDSGISIFNHLWTPKEKILEENLFSGMIHGINLIVKESVDRGDVRELLMDNGVFIFHKIPKYPLFFALVTSKSSRVLRESLKMFSSQFINEYAKDLDNIHDVNRFNDASRLVAKYFPYAS